MTRFFNRRSGLLVALLGVVALVASACGSSSGDGGSWVIGMLGTNTGRASSSLAQGKPAMEAWAAWTNAHGGVNGHKIKVVYGDDQGETSVGLSQVQKMVQRDHIIALVGSTANSAPGIAQYLVSKGIPVIGGTAPTYVSSVKPFPKVFYPVGPTLAASSVTSFQAAKALGGTKAAIAYCAESSLCQSIVSTFKGFASQAGMTISHFGAVSATAPSYTAPCLAMKNSGADSMVLAVDNHTLSSVVQQCKQQGYSPIIIGQTVEVTPNWATDPNFAKSVGSLGAFPWWETSVPAIADYAAAMKQYDNSGDLAASTNPGMATIVWSAGQAFAAAAKAAKLGDKPTPAQVISGMNSFSGETLGGLIGSLTFSGDQRQGSDCAFEFNIVNKAFNTLNGGKPACISGS